LDDWSRLVDQTVESIVLRRKGFKKLAGKTLHFFNPARERDTLTKPTPVKWLAFPKNLDNQDDRWAKADKREFQDEYCEWEVTRNSDGELLEVTFTTEVPEVSAIAILHLSNGNKQVYAYLVLRFSRLHGR